MKYRQVKYTLLLPVVCVYIGSDFFQKFVYNFLSEWMFVASDILQALVILPLVFIGGRRSRPVWLASIAAFLSICCAVFAALILSEQTSEEVKTAVSYTHLDVYKRQVLQGLTSFHSIDLKVFVM